MGDNFNEAGRNKAVELKAVEVASATLQSC